VTRVLFEQYIFCHVIVIARVRGEKTSTCLYFYVYNSPRSASVWKRDIPQAA